MYYSYLTPKTVPLRVNLLQQIIDMRLSIIGSLVLAFILSVFPINYDWYWLRPAFVALMVIYWSINEPQYFGLYAAWLVGLLQDIVQLDILGPNAFLLLMISYICQLFCRRIYNYAIWRQSGLVFALISAYLFLSNWINGLAGLAGREAPILFILLNAIVSAFVWPLVVYLCQFLGGRPTWRK